MMNVILLTVLAPFLCHFKLLFMLKMHLFIPEWYMSPLYLDILHTQTADTLKSGPNVTKLFCQ
jgi:hypothetical protein